jgi:hypothetical protein
MSASNKMLQAAAGNAGGSLWSEQWIKADTEIIYAGLGTSEGGAKMYNQAGKANSGASDLNTTGTLPTSHTDTYNTTAGIPEDDQTGLNTTNTPYLNAYFQDNVSATKITNAIADESGITGLELADWEWVCFWFNFEGSGQHLIGNADANGGRFLLDVVAEGGSPSFPDNLRINADKWYFIKVRRTASGIRIFVNGTDLGEKTLSDYTDGDLLNNNWYFGWTNTSTAEGYYQDYVIGKGGEPDNLPTEHFYLGF